jgi:hypothetical protein
VTEPDFEYSWQNTPKVLAILCYFNEDNLCLCVLGKETSIVKHRGVIDIGV